MAWRAAASLLAFAIRVLAIIRATAAFARNPVRVLGAATIAGILTIAGIGAFNLSVAAALAATDLIASAS